MTADLTQATAAELGALYAARKASPVEAMSAVLARAERVNPRLNALTRVDATESLDVARQSESRWRAGTPLSPLDGVPVSIKELVRTAGWPLTMGSRLTDKSPATEDHPTVARLREAGAIVFAQSASPEYGYKGVTDSPLHGITRNPWNLERTPGGSSGGAGAAVAAGLGPLAIGTDGGGSVRIPASMCGLVGLKATFGRVPAWPASMHGDLANTGPMTRTALDCALMMNVIAKPDVRDPFALPPDGVDYVAALDRALAGRKVALMLHQGDHRLDDEIAAAVAAAAKVFETLGCVVEEAEAPFESDEAGGVWAVHWMSSIQRLLQLYPEGRHAEFDPGLLEQARIGAAFTVKDLVDAQARRREIAHRWNLFFARYDLALGPTLAVLPWGVGRNLPDGPDGKPNLNWARTVAYNLTRHPAASLPCGLSTDGLPIGLQIAAGHYKDAEVLAAAAAFARAAPFAFPDLPA
ncbi:MAG TPA: amidase [Caulobacteraceae bacterium]|nr:amidase [Caulobacteraceae bacterium]